MSDDLPLGRIYWTAFKSTYSRIVKFAVHSQICPSLLEVRRVSEVILYAIGWSKYKLFVTDIKQS